MKTSLRAYGRVIFTSNIQNPRRFAVLFPQLLPPTTSLNHRTFYSSPPLFKNIAAEEANAKLYEAAEWHDVPVVSVSGQYMNKSVCYGIYWGDNDPMNVLKTCKPNRANLFFAKLDGVLLALRQAIYERKLDKVIVRTDSEYLIKCAKVYLNLWRNNGFKKKDGQDVKNKADLQDLDTMLSHIEVKFELIQSPIEVFQKLRESDDVPVATSVADEDAFNFKAWHDLKKPIAYVCGEMIEREIPDKSDPSMTRMFKIASFGALFKGKENFDLKGRMGHFPTLLRAQMFGILKALQIAKKDGLQDIRIVTDSSIFIKHYRKGWKKMDGTPVANEPFYKEISQLADELNATFSYLKDDNDNPDFKNAKLLAQDGLSMPILEERKWKNNSPVD